MAGTRLITNYAPAIAAATGILGLSLLALAAGHAAAQPAADPTAALVQQTCTACHAASMFASRHQTREEWAKTVHQMIGYGADVPNGQVDPIVDYLTAHFGPTSAAKPPAK